VVGVEEGDGHGLWNVNNLGLARVQCLLGKSVRPFHLAHDNLVARSQALILAPLDLADTTVQMVAILLRLKTEEHALGIWRADDVACKVVGETDEVVRVNVREQVVLRIGCRSARSAGILGVWKHPLRPVSWGRRGERVHPDAGKLEEVAVCGQCWKGKWNGKGGQAREG
jgi:hypothetical protein